MKPKKAKIGCFTYLICFQPCDGENHGATDTDDKKIFIDSERPKQCQRETLYHELHHAAFTDWVGFKTGHNPSEDGREEDTIRHLSPVMFQILRDNKWIREFIFE